MRATTEKVTGAFLRGERKTVSNTSTDGAYLYLHGNVIAKRVDGQLWITNAGWFSATTKERLNALPGVNIHQKDFSWFLNGQPWDGKWTQIS
jgi:hypothetical protein